MKRKLLPVCALLCMIMTLFSCASGKTVAESETNPVVAGLRGGNAAGALAALDSSSYDDSLLYTLDHGVISFYARNYDAAIADLTSAEEQLEYNSIASVSEGVAGLIVNDNVKAFAGSNYEMLYIKALKAMAYAAKGDYESAMVEIRRANIISDDYALNAEEQTNWLESLVLAFTPNPFRYLEIPEVADYSNSALINYISMLFYRGMGDSGNANVDYTRLQSSVSDASLLSEDDVKLPSGKARINLISLTGLVAGREEVAVYAETSDVRHKVAWPQVVDRPNTDIASIDVAVSNGQSFTLSLLEDVSELAKSNVAMDTSAKYLGSFYRGYTKMALAKEAADEAYDQAVKAAASIRDKALAEASRQNALFAMAGKAAANSAYDAAIEAAQAAHDAAIAAVDSTELPDLRSVQYLPDRVWAGGITLDPGTYSLTVTYNYVDGSALTYSYSNVAARADRPTLVVSQCLK